MARSEVSDMRPSVLKVLLPVQEFVRTESASGTILLACTLVALAWANLPAAPSYAGFWETKAEVALGPWRLEHSLRHWINDGLMAVFFLLVGLEIKRELLVGELSVPRKAALPIVAAVGGMLVPAAVFAAFTWGTEASRGWGIPMATDIAFALGILSLVGRRVPLSLKVVLAALAIVDDLGAVLIIALVYTESVRWAALGTAAAVLALLLASNRAGVRNLAWYCLLGSALWLAVLGSGVHPTVAGVLLAATIPAWSRLDLRRFRERSEETLERIRELGDPSRRVLGNDRLLALVGSLELTCERVQPPLYRLEHALATVVPMGIMPLFALANAGVRFADLRVESLVSPLTLGVVLGLVAGKPLGIVGGAWLAVRCGLATLPGRTGWSQMWGLGFLGGIGFTMSIFMAGLALPDPALQDTARLAILGASCLAGGVGYFLLRARKGPPDGERGPGEG